MAADPFLGEIMYVGFGFAPRGWATCEGQILPINSNSALFALLGTTFGGDGRTTFALPDLRGRMPLGQGNGPGLGSIRWGEKTGREFVTLTAANLPSHSHSLLAASSGGTTNDPSGNLLSNAGFRDNDFGESAAAGDLVTMDDRAVSAAGSNQSFDIRNPYLGLFVCIALQGIFPSRS